MFKSVVAGAILLSSFSVFAADSESLQLPKTNSITITCLAPQGGVSRIVKGRDTESLVLKRVSAGNAIKYELYLYDALVFACDQVFLN